MKDTINVEKFVKYIAGFAARMKMHAAEAYKAQMLEVLELETYLNILAAKFGSTDAKSILSIIPQTSINTDVLKNVPAVLPLEGETMKYKGKTITRKADGRWWTRFTVKGKVYPVYGHTQAECLRKLKAALKQVEKGEKDYTKATLGEWLNKWLTTYKQPKCRSTTIDQMHAYLKAAEPLFNLQLRNISSLTLQDFLNGIDKPRKREKIQGFLKDAFTKAYKTRLIDYNPFDAIEPVKRQRKQSKSLTHEEEEKFTKACGNWDKGRFYLFCLYEGLRIGEAVALTYDDIDFERRTVTVNKSINTNGELTPPKTETSNRTIPLFERARALLDENGQGNVFEYNRKTYQNKLLLACRKLGLEGVTVHTLRHTFATRCSEAGIPPKMVQKWLGHSTVEMTLNVYTHVNVDFEREMTAKFDTFFDTSQK